MNTSIVCLPLQGAARPRRRLHPSTTLLFIVLIVGASQSFAAPITWTLVDVVFDDGGVATGSFTYDADFNLFTSIAITTSLGSLPGATYDTPHPLAIEIFLFFLRAGDGPDYTNDPFLDFQLSANMTNAGGIIPIRVGYESMCANSPCDAAFSGGRVTVQGSLVETSIPEPSTLALAILPAVAMLLSRRRSHKHNGT